MVITLLAEEARPRASLARRASSLCCYWPLFAVGLRTTSMSILCLSVPGDVMLFDVASCGLIAEAGSLTMACPALPSPARLAEQLDESRVALGPNCRPHVKEHVNGM